MRILARATALAGLVLGAAALATAQDRRTQPLLGPRLIYYPLECLDPRGCRIECFQNGESVVTRISLSSHDEIRLVVNSGLGEELLPRWIEVRPSGGEKPDTILLSRDAICDLQSLVIRPIDAP